MQLGGFLSDNILCLLAYSEKYAKIIRNSVPLNLYGGPHRIIASRIYDYIDSFGKPPADHCSDILEDKLGDNAEGSLYKNLILNIRNAQEGINTDYVIKTLEIFIKRQSLRSVAVELTKALQRDTEDSLEEAERLINQSRQSQLQLFDPGTRLSDKSKALSFLEFGNDCFPTGIPDLDKRGFGPTRKELWALIANTKMGKCVAKGELVLLADGSYVPIEQVPENSEIVTLNNSHFEKCKIANRLSNGVKEVVKVVTRTGRQIIVTPTHPFLTENGWVPLNQLKVTSAIAVPLKLPVFGSVIEDANKLRILGYMIADGGMTKRCTPTFTKLDHEIVDDMKHCLSSMGDRLVEAKSEKGQYYITAGIKFTECKTVTYLRNLGLMKKKSNEKFIPDFIFKLKKPLIAEFLSALFVCDGSVYDSKTTVDFEYSTTSRILAMQIVHLLIRFGILAKTRERWQTVAGKPYVSWNISIRSWNAVFMFKNEIGLRFEKGKKLDILLAKHAESKRSKRKSYLLTDNENDIFYDEIISITPSGISEVYDISVPKTHNFVASNIVIHNSWSLTHLAKMAIMHRLKVAHITLEMSEGRCAQRYFQTLYSIAKRPDKHEVLKFKKDEYGRLTEFQKITINPRATLQDIDIREKLEKLIDTWALRQLNNIYIKEFPTGSLTLNQLDAYLDNLEATQRHSPDLLILDYPDLMDFENLEPRWALDKIYKGLRGRAVSRNMAVAVVSQSNRTGGKAEMVGLDHIAEAYSKAQHADVTITLSATAAERRLGLARLYIAAGRNDESNLVIVISQHYKTGSFVLDSTLMTSDYFDQLPIVEGISNE